MLSLYQSDIKDTTNIFCYQDLTRFSCLHEDRDREQDIEMENGAPSEGKDPSSFLGEIIGAPVTVKLNSGVVYKGALLSQYIDRVSNIINNVLSGELQSVDGYMNIALEKSKEYVNGNLRQSYGDAFVRGNNGLFNTS